MDDLINELSQHPETIKAGLLKHSEEWKVDRNKLKGWLESQLLKSHEGHEIEHASIVRGAESLVIK